MSVVDSFLWGMPVLLMVILLPLVIYNRKKGEYKGFVNPLAILLLAASAAVGWRFIATSASPRLEPWELAIISVLYTILGSRIMVEIMHNRFHGEWLRKKGVWLLKKSRET